MNNHIQVIDRHYTKKKYPPNPGHEWDCFLHGTLIGRIKKNEEPNRWEKIYSVFSADPHYSDYDGPRMNHRGSFDTLYAAKVSMREFAEDVFQDFQVNRAKKAPPVYLPAADFEFYPTPSSVAGKLLAGIQWKKVGTVLEPSAGKGDLIECAIKHDEHETGRSRRANGLDVDCIEIDTNLQAILTGKGFRVVHDDFLNYVTRKHYDLILMNPPFSDGEKHLLYALDMCSNGGQVACILNAETIRNPYTNTRRVLLKKLGELGASIRYIEDAFARAERNAKVDVALINVSIPYSFTDETMWDNLRKSREEAETDTGFGIRPNEVSPADNIERLIREHDIMCEAGMTIMRTYNGIAHHIFDDDESSFSRPYITLAVGGNDCGKRCDTEDANKYLKLVRGKYWSQLFDLPMLRNKMTSDMQEQYRSLIQQMADYEFSKFNIQQVINRLMGQLTTGVEDAILKCFEKLSSEHHYSREVQNENVHYFTGWKTNKAHCVNDRVIIPTWGCFATEYRKTSRGGYSDVMTTIAPRGCFAVLDDLEKALNYLDKGETSNVDLLSVLEAAKAADRNRNIRCKYFDVTFFKKGTCHIKFHDRKIVDRLNIYVGRNKAWLPPSYGKVRYEQMDPESQRIVDEFQGRDAYEVVMANRDDYLIDVKEIPMLTA